MDAHRTPEEKRITIESMSIAGDVINLFFDENGWLYVGHEDEDGCHGAYVAHDQQVRLRDWLNKVIQ